MTWEDAPTNGINATKNTGFHIFRVDSGAGSPATPDSTVALKFDSDAPTLLFGITLVSNRTYFHNNQDKWPLRTFVTILVSVSGLNRAGACLILIYRLLDLAQTACATYNMHYYLISHFGEINILKIPTIMVSVEFSITSVTFFMVHMFFALRIWKLGKNGWLPAIITFASTAMLAVGGSAVYSQIVGRVKFNQFHQRRILIQTSLFHALGVFTDILITVSLSWLLSKAHTGFRGTQMVLHQLLMYTVTRGILVTLVQMGHIALYIFHPNNVLFWASLHTILTKLYILTTLVTLNSRITLRNTLQNVVTDSYRLSFAHPTPLHTDGDMELSRIPPDLTSTKGQIGPSIVQVPGGLNSESSTNIGRK
ncbi:hypothetical protein BDZ94DRAFT_1302899 [Collybia nuda]|uniref:DUF6534 domain-containing protein n=1 Tax=Collybia nuda TaxID=64659 RepID=A0A9P5XUM8_9AGAR|nr:hypothetical protein BDZ94DRAFT_1302899 [Collybia nuda]